MTTARELHPHNKNKNRLFRNKKRNRRRRNACNSSGRRTCSSIDLVPVKSIPTYGSSGDTPVGDTLGDCVEPVIKLIKEHFPYFDVDDDEDEEINIDEDGTVDSCVQFFVDCGRQRQDREAKKVLLEIDSEFLDTCGTYKSSDCETC